MTNRQAIEFASKHSFLELYEEGKKDGKAEAILTQANHDEAVKQAYQQGRADVIREVFAKIEQPNECLFNYQSACCYPIDDCMNCPITIDGMKQLKEQKND